MRPCSAGGQGLVRSHEADARREWATMAAESQTDPEQQCNLERFLNYLRTRHPDDRTPLDKQAAAWTLPVADGSLVRIRETRKLDCIPQDQLPGLPMAYRDGLQGNPLAACVAAPLIANGRFLGMLLADNAFNSEPIRPEALATLTEILHDAAIIWEREDVRRRDLTSAQREQLARLRDQTLREIQREDLRGGAATYLPRRTGISQGRQCDNLPVGYGWCYLSDRKDRACGTKP